MKISVAQLGARLHYAVPRLFHEAGMLERLFTDSYVGNKPWLATTLAAVPATVRPRVLDRWLGRAEPCLPAGKVTSFDALGIAYARARRRKLTSTEAYRLHRLFGERFQAALLRSGLGDANAVYVMTGAADQIVSAANTCGISTIMEQFDHTLGWRFYLQQRELDEWSVGSSGASLPDQAEIERAKEREAAALRGADLVIVASDYTRRSMAHDGYGTEHVRIVPYGIDLARWAPAKPIMVRPPGPLRILFVASVDLRKGILYLLEALKRMGTQRIEFRAAGTIGLDRSLLASYLDPSCFLGPVPRTQVQELFQWADIFVFPTLGEGFGMVQVEAIATGTPVIASTECGDVVRDGIDGHLVPPRDPDAIANWLDRYATDPTRLEPLRAAALERSQYFSLDAYAVRLLAAVREPDHGNRATAAA